MTRKFLRARIKKLLDKNHDKKLMFTSHRRSLLATLVRSLFENRCNWCDHLDEVHVINGCLGGPVANCNCTGFREEV